MEIICDREYRDLSRRKYFENWYNQYNQVTKRILSSISPFNIVFNQLQVSDRAIIIKAVNPQPFNSIRSTLLSQISLPVDTKVPPNILHCSIARYNKSIELDEVYKAVEGIEVDIEESISNFKLMKDLVPPDFNPSLVEEFKLSS